MPPLVRTMRAEAALRVLQLGAVLSEVAHAVGSRLLARAAVRLFDVAFDLQPGPTLDSLRDLSTPFDEE